jgi:GntR family transcriptional regulator/MocR family aminotransferase
MLPVVAVDRGSATPFHRQLYEGYRQAILDGRLRPGQRLPSTRGLAGELGLSRITVLSAFDQLLAEGYCEGRIGSGTFVARSLPDGLSTPVARAGRDGATRRGGRRTLSRIAAALERSPAPWLMTPGPFRVGDPAVGQFPLDIWSRLLSRRSRTIGAASLRYGDVLGYAPLREEIAAYLRTARGVRCEAGQVMIVSGSQQALEIAARALLDPGDQAWMEEPGYWGARDVLRAAGARLVPVAVDDEGLDVADGVARAPRARAAIVTPSHQFPVGGVLGAARRLQLLDWAREAGAWVIEDDYDSEYRYDGYPVAALQGLDRDSRVVYIGTFSKVLFPALRLGYLVIPPDFTARFAAVRHAIDICPPSFLQGVLADFIRDGHFARHLRRMRLLYGERRRALVQALRQELPGPLQLFGENAGMHLLAVLPRGWRDRPIAERAAREGLWVMPLSDLYLGRASREGFVLGYGDVPASDIPAAVRRLRSILESARR